MTEENQNTSAVVGEMNIRALQGGSLALNYPPDPVLVLMMLSATVAYMAEFVVPPELDAPLAAIAGALSGLVATMKRLEGQETGRVIPVPFMPQDLRNN
jgi:hypothetical protein